MTDTNPPDKAVLKAWGAYLRRKRADDLKLTQNELAERTGLDQGSISRAETGEGASLATVLRMAEGLGVSLTELASATDSNSQVA